MRKKNLFGFILTSALTSAMSISCGTTTTNTKPGVIVGPEITNPGTSTGNVVKPPKPTVTSDKEIEDSILSVKNFFNRLSPVEVINNTNWQKMLDMLVDTYHKNIDYTISEFFNQIARTWNSLAQLDLTAVKSVVIGEIKELDYEFRIGINFVNSSEEFNLKYFKNPTITPEMLNQNLVDFQTSFQNLVRSKVFNRVEVQDLLLLKFTTGQSKYLKEANVFRNTIMMLFSAPEQKKLSYFPDFATVDFKIRDTLTQVGVPSTNNNAIAEVVISIKLNQEQISTNEVELEPIKVYDYYYGYMKPDIVSWTNQNSIPRLTPATFQDMNINPRPIFISYSTYVGRMQNRNISFETLQDVSNAQIPNFYPNSQAVSDLPNNMVFKKTIGGNPTFKRISDATKAIQKFVITGTIYETGIAAAASLIWQNPVYVVSDSIIQGGWTAFINNIETTIHDLMRYEVSELSQKDYDSLVLAINQTPNSAISGQFNDWIWKQIGTDNIQAIPELTDISLFNTSINASFTNEANGIKKIVFRLNGKHFEKDVTQTFELNFKIINEETRRQEILKNLESSDWTLMNGFHNTALTQLDDNKMFVYAYKKDRNEKWTELHTILRNISNNLKPLKFVLRYVSKEEDLKSKDWTFVHSAPFLNKGGSGITNVRNDKTAFTGSYTTNVRSTKGTMYISLNENSMNGFSRNWMEYNINFTKGLFVHEFLHLLGIGHVSTFTNSSGVSGIKSSVLNDSMSNYLSFPNYSESEPLLWLDIYILKKMYNLV